MVDNVFSVKCRRTSAGYELCLDCRPEICVNGQTFEAAEADLFDAVAERLQVYTPVFEYTPPPPGGLFEKKFGRLGLVRVFAANTGLHWTNSESSLFVEGICPLCKRGRGQRSQEELIVDFTGIKSDGAYVKGRVGPRGSDMMHVFSEEFVDAVKGLGNGDLRWRAVHDAGGGKERYFEPIAERFAELTQPVGISVSGWNCPKCHRNGLYLYRQEGSRIQFFLNEETIPRLTGCFLMGWPSDYSLCMDSASWERLKGEKKWKGITSLPIGTVPRARVQIPPNLEAIPG